jgi:putative N6-adenine-specific DNA methylase
MGTSRCRIFGRRRATPRWHRRDESPLWQTPLYRRPHLLPHGGKRVEEKLPGLRSLDYLERRSQRHILLHRPPHRPPQGRHSLRLNNGGIPCQLRKYELFSGKYEEFRQEGGELDKQSADQKQDNSHFDRVRKDFGKKGSSFKKGDKPFKKDDKPFKKDFKKEGKKDDGDKKKRFFDKDGKAYERGHKPADNDKPKRPRKDSNTQRTYTIGKDGSISVSRGNFKRGADGKLEERGGEFQPRGRRTYDPNRPMFGEDFDMSKAVLDFTKKPEDK